MALNLRRPGTGRESCMRFIPKGLRPPAKGWPDKALPRKPGLPWNEPPWYETPALRTYPKGFRLRYVKSMPQSLSSVDLHLVFSTLGRQPLLTDEENRERMHAYLGGISGRFGCPTTVVGGVEDHVHVLARFGKALTIADWVKELKRASSLWAKEIVPGFAWQSGYGVFAVGRTEIEATRRYIENQCDHHRKESFQDEFRRLLEEHGLEAEERYLWD